MKKVILSFIAAFLSLAAFSQNFTVSYVNGYKILKGERPPINVRDFPEDAYEQGKIKIQIDRSYETRLLDVTYPTSSEGFVKTGLLELDNLNARFQATKYEPLFSALYETNSKSNEFRERHRAWGFHLWFTIELPNNVSVADAVEAYQALPFVEIAEPFYKTILHDADNHVKWTTNDPQINNQWHYNNTGQSAGTPGCDISLFDAWEIEKGNSDVIVSIVDQGVQINHPDLEANMWEGIGYNFTNNSPTISPGDHGCHTGGTVAAVSNNSVGVAGVAGGSGNGDGVRLMTCQVFQASGGGAGFQNAYPYAADNGSCISQNSWGYTAQNSYEQSVLNAIDYFIANGGGDVMDGGVVCFSTGNNNDYPYTGLEGNYYPGYYSPILSVVATNNQDKKAYYAHYGTWVGISAPGGETNQVNARGVLSCYRTSNGTYGYMQGTSMACPHVSGVAALLVSYAARNGYILSGQEVKDLLTTNVDEIYPLNPSYIGKMGTGRLNAHKALTALTEMLVFVNEPEPVNAAPVNYSEIEINWQKNEDNNNVIILSNLENIFGKPVRETEYHVGDVIPDGGEVIYIGDEETFIHSELLANTTYYYKLFSYNPDYVYSKGIVCEATTLCKLLDPVFEGFEDGNNICLEQEYITGESSWKIGAGNGDEFPNHAFEGLYNVYFAFSTASDVGNVSRFILPAIEMTTFNDVRLSFALHNQVRSSITDVLTVYYKTSEATEWLLWTTFNGNQEEWKLETLTLPEKIEAESLQICFEGKIRGGYGLCIDNIATEAFFNTGIPSHRLENELIVFPNPTTGEMRIMNGALRAEDIENIEIFDMYGRKQNAKGRMDNNNGVVIDISHLAAGVYLVKVADLTVKVIKE